MCAVGCAAFAPRVRGGLLANRSFGGAQVSRTFYARGQTGQQLLLGAYQALEKEIAKGGVTMFPRAEMLDLIVVNGRARGIVVRDELTGTIEPHMADAVVLATGGYGNVFYLSTNAKGCNATAIWRAYRRGTPRSPILATHRSTRRAFLSPAITSPSSRSCRSRCATMGGCGTAEAMRGRRSPSHRAISRKATRDYFLERKYPAFGNLCPRDIASRAAKEVCDEGRGVGPGGRGVYLDFADAIKRLGEDKIRERYGNLFEMYARITDEDPYAVPMRIYPAAHYTMGGLWVDYNLMSSIPGNCTSLGEAELLRSRLPRSAPARSALDAGTRRRVLHPSVHHRRLPGVGEAGASVGRRTPKCAPPKWHKDVRESHEQAACSVREGDHSAPLRRFTVSVGHNVGVLRAWRATRLD